MIYTGTREDRQRREVRILQERLARFEAHPLYREDRGTFARLAAEAVREKLRAIGQNMRRAY
jgi:hypothetical protein